MAGKAKKSLDVLDQCQTDILNCVSKFSMLSKDRDDFQLGYLKDEANKVKEHVDNVIDASKKSRAKCNAYLTLITNSEP